MTKPKKLTTRDHSLQQLFHSSRNNYDQCNPLCCRSEETRAAGLTLLVDARSAQWRTARAHIRRASLRLGSAAATVIALRPDGFWDKQRVDNYCTRARGDGEVSERAPALRYCIVRPRIQCICAKVRARPTYDAAFSRREGNLGYCGGVFCFWRIARWVVKVRRVLMVAEHVIGIFVWRGYLVVGVGD